MIVFFCAAVVDISPLQMLQLPYFSVEAIPCYSSVANICNSLLSVEDACHFSDKFNTIV